MKTKIFGIGFQKTGTSSLESALEFLGYKSCKPPETNSIRMSIMSGNPNVVGLKNVIGANDFFQDDPWYWSNGINGEPMFKWVYENVSDAKFILTIRSSSLWVKSLMNHIQVIHGEVNWRPLLGGLHCSQYLNNYGVFPNEFVDNQEKLMKTLDDYTNKCVEFFKDKEDIFLPIHFEKNEGWKEICSFLKIEEVPTCEFPHKNRRLV